jgi:hypothetical protein
MHDPLKRHHQGGLTGDMIHQRDLRSRGNSIHNWRDNFILVRKREGDGSDDHFRAAAFRDEIHYVAAGIILVIGHQNFIAALKSQRAKNCIHAGGRVPNKNEILRFRANESRER